MKSALFFLTIAFSLTACDQAIESRLKSQTKVNKDIATLPENISDKKDQLEEPKVELLSDEKKLNTEESNEKKAEQPLEKTVEIAKEPEVVKENSNIAVVPIAKVSVSPPSKNTQIIELQSEKEFKVNSPKKEVKVVKKTVIKFDSTVKTLSKSSRNQSKLSTEAKDAIVPTSDMKKAVTVSKEPKADNKSEDENLVSNFSLEELRVGYQRPLSKAEIQYYKSLCRYAYMSEQDIIDNRCETKKVSIK